MNQLLISNFNYQQFYQEQDSKTILEMIKKFEDLDNLIAKTRNKKQYIIERIASRIIITLAGKFTFKRRIYKTWNQEKRKWNYVALLDQKIGLPKYCNLSIHLKTNILQYLASGKRYQDILDIFNKTKISKMTISRVFKNHPPQKVTNRKDLSNAKYLYLSIDDTFVRLRKDNNKSKKYPIRLLTLFSNKVNKKLINSTLIPIFNPKQYDFKTMITKIKTLIATHYSNGQDIKLIVVGDGAPWIKKIAKFLEGKFILDKFHAYTRLRRIMITSNKNQAQINDYNIATAYFNNGQYYEFINFLKSKNQKLASKYWINNRFGIINQNLEANLGNVAEPMISANIKNLLGYGNKTYNYYIFKNMVEARCQNFN